MAGFIFLCLIIAIILYLEFFYKKAPIDKTPPYKNNNNYGYYDTPWNFGYNNNWIAVKTKDKEKLAGLLRCEYYTEALWIQYINSRAKGATFISPPVGDWTFVLGHAVGEGSTDKQIGIVENLLNRLSKEFGEAQYYSNRSALNQYCWIKSSKGEKARTYAYNGQQRKVIKSLGDLTPIELNLNLKDPQNSNLIKSDKDPILPNEDVLFKIAHHWSIAPIGLDQRDDIGEGPGLFVIH